MRLTNQTTIPSSLALILTKNSSSSHKHQLTPFQIKVYSAACLIPSGRVATYQQVARHIGCKSAQAVGQALKRNPYAPAVPCHRVVAIKTIGGFFGQRDGMKIDQKKQLLLDEGVDFDANGRIKNECYYTFNG